MKFNHYYEELGYKPTDYPFELNGEDSIEDEEGFSATEFYELDHSLALHIYSRLRYFQDHCLIGYPSYMTFEEWQNILNKMIKAFKLYLTSPDIYDEPMSKNRRKQINYGMRLFIKYFSHL